MPQQTYSAEFLAGVRAELPLLLGVMPFGLIFGVLGLAVGMPGWAVVLSSSLIFGGSSQVVFAQLWGGGTPPPVMVTTVGVVNLRHLLYSAAVADYLRDLPWRWKSLLAYLLTDEAYAVAILRYARPAGPGPDLRHWYFLGCGLTLWGCWQLSTALGIAFGARSPPEWDIDFAVPLTFIALLTLLVKERAGQAAALVAALAVLALAALPFRLGLVLAIVLGLLAGAAVARRGEARR